MSYIVGLSGSLREASFNSGLLDAAGEAFPEVIVPDSIKGIPLYDADVEAEGLPESVVSLRTRIDESAGLLLVTPEYNNSMPGVFKNAIDWLSRPPDEKNVFEGKPVGLIGATPGGFGTVLSQTAWLPVLRTLGMRHWTGGRLSVSGASARFDDEGRLTDQDTRDRLRDYLSGFVAFCGL